MSDIEANKKICLSFFDLATTGQVEAARAVLHDEVEWWIVGDLPTSGTHKGSDTVMNLFAMLGQALAGPIKLDYTAITAEEDRVAVEMTSDGTFIDGRPYQCNYHLLFRVEDSKIRSVREYLDTKYVASVFPM